MRYDFIYNDAPAFLEFSDVLGELSEIWYFDKGVLTRRVIEKFCFNERMLSLIVEGEHWVYYNDVETLVKAPEKFTFDATSQETLEYFAQPSTPEKVKRMQVNGTAIEYLNMILFNPETGAFEPVDLTPTPAPTE